MNAAFRKKYLLEKIAQVEDCDPEEVDYVHSAFSFPQKLYIILENGSFVDYIRWENDLCFRLIEPERFIAEVLPKFFKQTKMTSFQRQLNSYGFRKISKGVEAGCFFHPKFQRGKLDMLIEVERLPLKGSLDSYEDIKRANDSPRPAPLSLPSASFANYLRQQHKPPKTTEPNQPQPEPPLPTLQTCATALTTLRQLTDNTSSTSSSSSSSSSSLPRQPPANPVTPPSPPLKKEKDKDEEDKGEEREGEGRGGQSVSLPLLPLPLPLPYLFLQGGGRPWHPMPLPFPATSNFALETRPPYPPPLHPTQLLSIPYPSPSSMPYPSYPSYPPYSSYPSYPFPSLSPYQPQQQRQHPSH